MKSLLDVSCQRKSTQAPMMEEYRPIILANLLKAETARVNYFGSTQTIISEKMRMICVSWMHEVALEFKLLDQTLYLAVQYLDTYLASKDVGKDFLQLVAIVALLLASKFNEIHPRPIKDFVWISANTYTAQRILTTEHKFLQVLEYNLHAPTVHDFVSAFVDGLKLDEPFPTMAHYYCDITLQEFVFHKYKPSVIALAAVITAMCRSDWPLEMIVELEPYIDDLYALASCCADLQTCHVKNYNEYTGVSQSINRRPNAIKMKYKTTAVTVKPGERAPSFVELGKAVSRASPSKASLAGVFMDFTTTA